ncbi:MAG: methionyl-tRNA formyltransferase [Candidatus Helarchaeota archaeon]
MKIALLGCKGTTLDLLHSIITENQFQIDLVITLPSHLGEQHGVAFYRGVDLVEYCKTNSIPYHIVKSYNLKDLEDITFFKSSEIDLLLVIGWERLIPSTILESLGKFACGMHGSAYGLPKGRGRSPMNWSLIQGLNRFITNLYKYDPHIDAGHIIGFQVFEINEFDTIASLHMKNRIAMYQLLKTYLPLIEKNEIVFKPQPPLKPTFYPKRTPTDSGIDWNLKTLEIYNLIRAVSFPYPPAYCFYQGTKIFIQEAFPFDSALFHNAIAPGTILDLSIALNQFVVKTKDGSLLVKKFEGLTTAELKIGAILEGVDSKKILQEILTRYHPETPKDQREIQ